MSSRQRLASTPLYDQWRERLRSALASRGAKTQLAQHMAAHRNQQVHPWQIKIAAILRNDLVINAEDLLAITAWMETAGNPGTAQAPPRRRRPRPPAPDA